MNVCLVGSVSMVTDGQPYPEGPECLPICDHITSVIWFVSGQLGEATPRLRGSWEPENQLRKSRARASGISYLHLHY